MYFFYVIINLTQQFHRQDLRGGDGGNILKENYEL